MDILPGWENRVVLLRNGEELKEDAAFFRLLRAAFAGGYNHAVG